MKVQRQVTREQSFSPQTRGLGLEPIDKRVDLTSTRMFRTYDITILAEEKTPRGYKPTSFDLIGDQVPWHDSRPQTAEGGFDGQVVVVENLGRLVPLSALLSNDSHPIFPHVGSRTRLQARKSGGYMAISKRLLAESLCKNQPELLFKEQRTIIKHRDIWRDNKYLDVHCSSCRAEISR